MPSIAEIMDLCKEIVRIRRVRDSAPPQSDQFYACCALLVGKYPLLAHLCEKHGASHYEASEFIDMMCAKPSEWETLWERRRLDDGALRR